MKTCVRVHTHHTPRTYTHTGTVLTHTHRAHTRAQWSHPALPGRLPSQIMFRARSSVKAHTHIQATRPEAASHTDCWKQQRRVGGADLGNMCERQPRHEGLDSFWKTPEGKTQGCGKKQKEVDFRFTGGIL